MLDLGHPEVADMDTSHHNPDLPNTGSFEDLGERTLTLDSTERTREAVAHLLRNATGEVVILSHNLDRRLFDDPDVLDAARRFLVPQGRVLRVLVRSGRELVTRTHRLMTLVPRFPERFLIRQLHARDRTLSQVYVVSDGVGVLHKPVASQREARFGTHNPWVAQRLLAEFETLWNRAEVVVEARRLGL